MSLDLQKTWAGSPGRKRLPPLRALRAFEAASRLGSFARAAQELFVTQTAVSHQIKLLEEHVGGLVFERMPAGLTLTTLGRTLYPLIASGFEQFDVAMSLLPPRQDAATPVLVISALPSFAQEWLMPRLVDFRVRWPDVDVLIETDYRMADLSGGGPDIAIRFGRGSFGNELHSEHLSTETVMPVCSPALVRRAGSFSPRDIADLTLLQSSVRMVHEPWMSWDPWLDEIGLGGVKPANGPRFSDPLLILRAAIAGRGVVLGRSMLVRDHLASRRLVAPFAGWVKPILSSYYVVSTKEKSRLQRVSVFREWILETARREAAAGAEPLESKTSDSYLTSVLPS